MSNTLEALKHTIDAWRRHPTTLTNRVPEDIKRQVAALMPEYKVAFLAQYFGFGESTLPKWQRQYGVDQHYVREPQFIELPSVQPEPQPESMIQVHCSRSGLEIKAALTCEQFQQLFMHEELATC